MKRRTTWLWFLIATCSFAAPQDAGWKKTVTETIPLYGHRNWIVIADSAYPDQSAAGIETIVSGADQIEVLKFVLAKLVQSPHVSPTVYTDRELNYLDDKDAPGISAYRDQLATLLKDRHTQTLPHEQIIAKLDQVSRAFHVLIVKTTLALPYTSVFMQLDCAYWPSDAEKRLRERMGSEK
ncbi:MAG: hypothetical protein JO061_18820 [Acidobacteriaceae bacterium]|nr:hypothetical protein [Acidobacteriaceae bacterium]